MTVQAKILALRKAMLETQIDAYVVPSTDPHQSEYPAGRWAAREWLSGFTGSAGTLVVTLHEAKLWTDSRYFLQADTQLAGTGIELMKDRLPETPSIEDWLGTTLLDGQTVGADGRVISAATARRMENKLSANKLKFVTDDDLLRRVWSDRPAVPNRPIFEHSPDFSGEPWQQRLARLTEWMTENELDYYVVSALDEVAWLLNLRGSDIDHNPLCVAYFVAGRKGDHAIFAAKRLEFSLWIDNVPEGHQLELHPYEQISSYLRRTNAINADIGLDPESISDRLCMHAGEQKTSQLASPIPAWKAIKNETALAHLRETMAHDAVALLRLRRWLDGAIAEGVDEAEVALQLAELRGQHSHYVTESFSAIVGYGGNGAIVHYRAPDEGSARLVNEGILLLDSGGQYHTGTTDITRTFAIGPVTNEMRTNHTLVLQGHIDLATARFPAGTTGVQLDALARRPLWQHGLNYGHGTGHGVGFFLNVHEGPAGILANPKVPTGQKALQSGMVLSNEPGYYKTGEYGIRVENLVVVREAEAEGFLEFETITLFPIDRALIVTEMLSPDQRQWVDDYHKMVLDRVGPLLEGEELDWLTEACQPL